MDAPGKTEDAVDADAGLDALQRLWPPDDGACGYGVAAYIGMNLITCRLYDFSTNKMLAMLRAPGEYASLPGGKLMDVLTSLMCQLAENADVPLSKLTVAVVSGTTAMESKAAGVDPADLQHNMEEGLEEFGRDVEYMLAGTNAIAVGNAYFTPCLTPSIGGDFLCSLLAVDILQAEEPLLLINTDPQDDAGVVLAYGNKDTVSICAVPKGVSIEQGMMRLLEVCEAELERIEHALLVGYSEIEVPSQLQNRTSHLDNAAIDGASAVLLSEMAEDELCRIASACRVVNL